MLKVGLTGGIGSGKSYVSGVFRSLGIPVYEADKAAKRLMVSNKDLMDGISAEFGDDVYMKGALDNNLLASMVFKSPERLKVLNGLVHPVVQLDFERWASEQKDTPYVVEEAAVLFESGSSKHMDITIAVIAEEETKVERVMSRDNTTEDQIKLRMDRQMSNAEFKEAADFIIYNEKDSMILPQILDLHEKICSNLINKA